MLFNIISGNKTLYPWIKVLPQKTYLPSFCLSFQNFIFFGLSQELFSSSNPEQWVSSRIMGKNRNHRFVNLAISGGCKIRDNHYLKVITKTIPSCHQTQASVLIPARAIVSTSRVLRVMSKSVLKKALNLLLGKIISSE